MGEGFYITLFSPSDVTAFHRMKYGGRGYYITLFSPGDVTAFHRIGDEYLPVFLTWVTHSRAYDPFLHAALQNRVDPRSHLLTCVY